MPNILRIDDNTYEIIAGEIRLGTSVLKREFFPPIPFADGRVIEMRPDVYRTYKSLMAGLAAYDAARAAGRNWRRCKREKRRAMLQVRADHRARHSP